MRLGHSFGDRRLAKVRNLEEAMLAFDIRYFDSFELVEAVKHILATSVETEVSEQLSQITRLNTKLASAVDQAPALLRSHIDLCPTPAASRARSLEVCAMALLKDRLERYQDSFDLPYSVCRMVGPIEYHFDDPAWLGDLWNACERCAEDSLRKDFPEVRQQAERVAKDLKSTVLRDQ